MPKAPGDVLLVRRAAIINVTSDCLLSHGHFTGAAGSQAGPDHVLGCCTVDDRPSMAEQHYGYGAGFLWAGWVGF